VFLVDLLSLLKGFENLLGELIIFFGPDGSGKSTQVKLLINYLRSQKIKVKKVWIRSPHTLAYLFSRLLKKAGFYRIILTPHGVEQKMFSLPSDGAFRSFWYLLELISVKPLILLKVRFPLLLGYTVVADRFVVDTVVNLAYYGNDVKFVQSSIANLFFRLIPKNASLIHLDSDYSTILKRRGIAVDSLSFIEFQRTAYKLINRSIQAKKINTSKSTVIQTSQEIQLYVE
jgi:energy-coupling factor transporter ATP-binding protein EcfA2